MIEMSAEQKHGPGLSSFLLAYTNKRTLSNCFRKAIQSAHSCTLSNELRHFSTCCTYFLNLGSEEYGWTDAPRRDSADIFDGVKVKKDMAD